MISFFNLRWGLEAIALISGLLYIYFAHKKSNRSWIFGIISALCILIVDVRFNRLYFDAILHGFFILMSSIGIYLWIADKGDLRGHIRMSSMNKISYMGYLTLSMIIAGATGYLFNQQTDASFPYLDCFQMMLSIFATFLIMYCVIEAWSYWIIVDIISISLYALTGSFLLAILYVGYLISNSIQWNNWRKLKSSHNEYNNLIYKSDALSSLKKINKI